MRYFLRNEKYTCQVTSTWVVGQNIGNGGPFYPRYTYMIIRQYHQLKKFRAENNHGINIILTDARKLPAFLPFPPILEHHAIAHHNFGGRFQSVGEFLWS